MLKHFAPKHFAPFLPRMRSRMPLPPSSSSPFPSAGEQRDRQREREHAEGERAADELDALHGLPAVATTALMSARVGSIADNRLGGWYSYWASKTAVNRVVRTFDNYLRTRRMRMRSR